MKLLDAHYALQELAAGRLPDLSRAAAGRIELEFMLRSAVVNQGLRDAAALLELLVTTKGSTTINVNARTKVWLATLNKSRLT